MTRSSIPAGSVLPSAAPCNDDCRPFDKLRRRALNGPDQEVYFPPEHPPGREAQFDFTHGSSLGVTIAGQPYRHQLFQLILSHSGWRYAEIAAGETFLALQHGLQSALWTLGGVPLEVWSESDLSGFPADPRRRIPVLYGVIVYDIRLTHLVLQVQKCGEEFQAASVMAAAGRCLVPPSPPGPPQH